MPPWRCRGMLATVKPSHSSCSSAAQLRRLILTIPGYLPCIHSPSSLVPSSLGRTQQQGVPPGRVGITAGVRALAVTALGQLEDKIKK